ncbi:MAG: hypothetical protein HC831_24140 [Chloroflexia bacterium]|nr:hypothetical protein [Chloroflexia bacterium]
MKKNLAIAVVMILFFSCNNGEKNNELVFKFEQQSSKNGISIRGLHAVNEQIAWISGSKGTFAKTIDGGKNWDWDSIPNASNLDFRDIIAFDENRALVISAGLPAKIYKTIDGGKNWEEKYSDTTTGVFFNSFDFWNENEGIAASDPLEDGFLIIETQNGGETWTRINPLVIPENEKGEAQFAASGTCLVTFGDSGVCFVTGGAAARAFVSTNRGKSWNVFSSPIAQNEQTKGIYSVDFLNKDTAYVVGGDYLKPEIKTGTAAFTQDGGKTWQKPISYPPTGFNSCVKYIPNTSGQYLIAVGTEGSNISRDGGKNWLQLDTIPYHTVAFAGTVKYGWAAGSDGRIARITLN